MNRITFRGRCEGVAWQRQLRDQRLAEGTPPVPHLDVGRAIVRPVSRALATQIILRYEWLGTMATTNIHYGLFFGPYCAGVTCVNLGLSRANRHAHLEVGLAEAELAYLARGACVHWAPPGANSKLVAWTARLLRGRAKAIIAYADTDAGEIGTIYQACGWAYIGLGASTQQWVAPNGAVRDQLHPLNLARRRGGTRREWVERLVAAGWRRQASNPKHRYVGIIDRDDQALVERIEAMRLPYPKRAPAASSDALAIQAREGGAAPTPALQ